MLLSLDIGTTHIKAGVFGNDGSEMAVVSAPNPKAQGPSGTTVYDPDVLWETAAGLIQQAVERLGERDEAIDAVGITSMAESGLLLNPADGRARTPMLPWFETCSAPQAERIRQEVDERELFRMTGLRPSFKHGLPKLLWLREAYPDAFDGSVWLSAASYIAYRLTGRIAEDETLAARTYAYRIDSRAWNEPLIRSFGLDPQRNAGRDVPLRPLGDADDASGLSFGIHPVPGRMYWMGGHSSSGGSVEWAREALSDAGMSYPDMMRLLDEAGRQPTGILYYPYLTGSGAPHPVPGARAAFIGLDAKHKKGDLIRAVLEGNAYQLELLRERAERVGGSPIRRMHVVGGGARNSHWLQIKADVSGVRLTMTGTAEASLLGAALAAAVGASLYPSFREAAAAVTYPEAKVYEPDPERHLAYRKLYEQGFLGLLQPLLSYYKSSS
ncbi:L-fuculokinase [Paenibacillus sp. AR247]|uniref:FGGY-family carbohydrate kinase n=1 Tax=Paenibacillus sp. AR247 TaxID=1631599 RepID=UPI000CF9362F|nr:FGGY-family carbohydrate kinase [Paenibacillus sp. AR247]PQP88244.1 carbohydrate kinase [Paenibacillus sp. AR247]